MAWCSSKPYSWQEDSVLIICIHLHLFILFLLLLLCWPRSPNVKREHGYYSSIYWNYYCCMELDDGNEWLWIGYFNFNIAMLKINLASADKYTIYLSWDRIERNQNQLQLNNLQFILFNCQCHFILILVQCLCRWLAVSEM